MATSVEAAAAAAAQREVKKLAARIAALEKQVRAQATAAGLAHSSIEGGGAVESRESDGTIKQTTSADAVVLVVDEQVVGLLTKATPGNALPTLTYNPDSRALTNGGIWTTWGGGSGDLPIVTMEPPRGLAGVEDDCPQLVLYAASPDGTDVGAAQIFPPVSPNEDLPPSLFVDPFGPVLWGRVITGAGVTTRPFLWVHDDGISMPTKIQCGEVVFPSVSGTVSAVTVLFGTAFNSTPRVVMTPRANTPQQESCSIAGPSATGFTARAQTTGTAGARTYEWIAIAD